MHDLALPLTLALVALVVMIMADPLTRPANPLAGGATLMLIAAVVTLPLPLSVGAPVALSGWGVAIIASGVALRAIGLHCLRPQQVRIHATNRRMRAKVARDDQR